MAPSKETAFSRLYRSQLTQEINSLPNWPTPYIELHSFIFKSPPTDSQVTQMDPIRRLLLLFRRRSERQQSKTVSINSKVRVVPLATLFVYM